MDSLYAVLQNSAMRYPRRKAIAFYGRYISYARLLRYVDCFAFKLKYHHHIQVGDLVTVCMPNSPSATIALYAINKIGAICNLVHPFVPVEQLKQEIERTNTKLLVLYDVYTTKNDCSSIDTPLLLSNTGFFMGRLARAYYTLSNRKIEYSLYSSLEKYFLGYSEKLDYYHFAQEEDAVYLPSGGTTGMPKIIRHNVQSFNALCKYAQFFMSKPVPQYKSMYSVLPIFHGFGLCMNTHMCIMFAMLNVMSVKFNTKHMARAIGKHKVGVLTGVPTMYARLLKDKAFTKGRIRSLTECFVGGDSLPQSIAEQFDSTLKARGSKGRLLAGYGMTETIAVCIVNRINHNKSNSIGMPIPEAEVLIMKDARPVPCGEVGEIWISSPIMMLGYFGEKENPIVEYKGKKYLQTGDCGYVDEEGYVYFKQREKNIIKVNGMTVFPQEIEQVVQAVEGVANAVAISMPDNKRGQSVRLILQLNNGCDKDAVIKDVENACRKNLIVYACPRQIDVVDKLPLNMIGKVDRRELENQLNNIDKEKVQKMCKN